MLYHDYFYTCNAQKNQKVGAQIYTEGEKSGQGYFPPSGGRVWGGGCAPSSENFWDFLPENGTFWLHTQDFPSVLFIFAAQEFFPKTNG